MVATSPLSIRATMATASSWSTGQPWYRRAGVVTGFDITACTEVISPHRKRAWSTAWQAMIASTPAELGSGPDGSVRHCWE